MKKTLERGLEIAEEHVASLMHRPANQLRFFGSVAMLASSAATSGSLITGKRPKPERS